MVNKMKWNVLCEKLISVAVERRKPLFLHQKLIERDHVKHKRHPRAQDLTLTCQIIYIYTYISNKNGRMFFFLNPCGPCDVKDDE